MESGRLGSPVKCVQSQKVARNVGNRLVVNGCTRKNNLAFVFFLNRYISMKKNGSIPKIWRNSIYWQIVQ